MPLAPLISGPCSLDVTTAFVSFPSLCQHLFTQKPVEMLGRDQEIGMSNGNGDKMRKS